MRTLGSVKLLLIGALFALGLAAPDRLVAQATGQVSGTVTTGTGSPLAGVTVAISGASSTVVTGADGRYSVSGLTPGQHTIRATIVGYQEGTRTVNVVAGRTATADLTLVAQAIQLEGLVAVGYGTQQKVNITGAVGSVDSKQLTERPVGRVTEALQGSTPGLTVIQRSAQPGHQDIQFNIRGRGSLNSTTPLVLIDGVPGDINQINPQDIDNISVLKDAASAAIYGSRAANGVILVTTRRGRNTNGLRLSYNGYYGIQGVAALPKAVGPRDYMELINEASVNAGYEPKYSEDYIQNTIKARNGELTGEEALKYPWTDWLGTIFNPAPIQDHTVGIMGGNDLARFKLSLNYFDQEGMTPQTGADRLGLRFNSDFDINSRLSAGVDLALRQNSDWEPRQMGDVMFRMLHDTPPMTMAKYPDGTYGWSRNGHNPLAYAEAYGRRDRTYRHGTVNAKADYKLTDNFTIRTLGSVQVGDWSYRSWLNRATFRDYWNPSIIRKSVSNNSLDERKSGESETYLRLLGDYNRIFGDHEITVMGGYDQTAHDWSEIRASRSDFYSNDLQEINAGDASRDGNWGTSNEWRLRSGFGRVSYSFRGKYLLEANGRYDGSSRFAKGNRYGFFPSFSAGWRISEEPFFRDNIGFISDLKLRGSWGRMGNQDIGLYRYYSTIDFGHNYVFGDALVTGSAKTDLANTDISWETTEMSDIGIDAAFLDNRLAFTGDLYRKDTKGILLDLPIPGIIGLNAPVQNAGKVRNSGWEAALSWQDQAGEFGYSMDVNLSDNHNMVVDLAGTGPYISGLWLTQEGYPMGSMWGYEAEGLFVDQADVDSHAKQQDPRTGPGDIRFVDQNSDGVINDDDKVVIGNDLPRYLIGSNLSANYKGFDVGVLFQGVLKANAYIEGALVEGPVWENYTTTAWLDHWTKENPDRNARMPKPALNWHQNFGSRSSFWVQDVSYMKLKTAQIGYTLPSSLANRFDTSSMRIYVSGQNLLTFTDQKWVLDPEFPSGRATVYPQTRTVSIGTSITF